GGAQRDRATAGQAEVIAVRHPSPAHLPVEVWGRFAACQLQARLANALLVDELRQLGSALQPVGEYREVRDLGHGEQIAPEDLECGISLAPQGREMLAGGRLTLPGASAIQFRPREGGLGGEYDRFRRSAGLVTPARRSNGAFALVDVQLRKLAFALRTDDRQVAAG